MIPRDDANDLTNESLKDEILSQSFIATCEYHESLPSTNDVGLHHSRQLSASLPYLILADHQTQGRGRDGRHWVSPPGGLTFTVVIAESQLSAEIESSGVLSLRTALAIRGAIKEYSDHLRGRGGCGADGGLLVQVKWPNDVYLLEKKLAGILIESTMAGERRFIVGVGINANGRLCASDFRNPSCEPAVPPVTLEEVLGQRVSRKELLLTCLRHLEAAWTISRSEAPLVAEWSKYCLLTGRPVRVATGGDELRGTVAGIDSAGCLLLRQGRATLACASGHVTIC